MKKINKKVLIIVLSAVIGVLAATVACILLIKGMQKVAPSFKEISTNSDISYTEEVRPPTESVAPPTVSSEPEDKGPALEITSPKSGKITVTEPLFVITGTADAKEKLTMNGQNIEISENGSFSVNVELKVGANSFLFSHKGVNKKVTVNYRYVVIDAYSPSKAESYESGSTVIVTVAARAGSTVSATFNGETIQLVRQELQESEEQGEFLNFSGSFKLPGSNREDLNLGNIKFIGTYNGVTEKFSSGKIICKKTTVPQVAEITAFTAETFNSNTVDDYSDPRNNYLPEGTMDQVIGTVYYKDMVFLKLRSGQRIFLNRKLDRGEKVPVAEVYDGTLPSTNSLEVASVTSDERYTYITLNTQWKAPFYLDVLPQSYKNPSKRDFTVASVTGQYVEIRFCYAISLTGDITIAEDNPLFSRAETVNNGTECLLRLYLKEQGGFRGWDSQYNAQGQLCFSFLHAKTAIASDNAYSTDLTGIRIVVDAGHGGVDSGAVNKNYAPAYGYEAHRNLALANMLKAELESMGATVIMTRSSDTYLNADERRLILRNAKADLCISLHHDSNQSVKANGFGAYHFNAWSSTAAGLIYNRTMNTGIYDINARNNKLYWHYFFLARASYCPVVLTENGFMRGEIDSPGIVSDEVCAAKARAIAQGIADYFINY